MINKVTILLGASLIFGVGLQASTVDYAFGGLGTLGSTHTFSPTSGSGPNITATGFKAGSPASAVDLYSKGSGVFPPPTDESGLGLINDRSGDGEITAGSFIMLDVGSLSLTTLDIYTGSATDGEEWAIWGSNTAAVAGHNYLIPTTGLITGTTEGSQNVSSLSGDRYLFITAESGNILLGGVATAAPEPASAGLLGLALVGCGLLFRRQLRKEAKQS